MRSKLLGLFVFLIFLTFLSLTSLFLSPKVFADEDFDISTNAKYIVSDTGVTHVLQVVSIKNKKDFVYTPDYTISTGFTDLKNVKATNSDGSIDTLLKQDETGESIQVTFPKRVVGVGNVNQFTISFDTNQIAKNKGDTWEVNIPGIADVNSFVDYNSELVVPVSFGAPNIVKPFKKLTGRDFFFSKDETGTGGISLVFGDNQFYTFSLSYHLGNNQIVPVKTEIALPPPTSYQDVRIKSLSPAPENMYQDDDGNWLAVYSLNPRQEVTVKAVVIIKVLSDPKADSKLPAEYYISQQKYWDINDPRIKSTAKELATPRAIYNYVVNKLSYDFSKVSSSNVRLGAAGVLSHPNFAVCLEFTDLFVALARAAGIPARAVEGYAYTDNSRLRPLSQVNDVLHSWPEFYDKTSKKWIMVDPTWGNTTHGMDYFSTLDFDHIAFVINGHDSSYPVPAGGYKLNENSKDVEVTLGGENDFTNIIKSSLNASFPKSVLSALSVAGSVTIKNEGNIPISGKEVMVESNLQPNKQVFNVGTVLPYGKKTLTVGFAKTPVLTNQVYQATISYDGESVRKQILVGLFPDYFIILAGGILIVGSTLVASIAYKTWSLYFSRKK